MPAEEKQNKGLSTAFQETKTELKKVHWPSKKELINYTWIVLSSVAAVSLIIFAIDKGLSWVVQKAISL